MKEPIAIVGMGISGQSAYKLLKILGFNECALSTFDQEPGKGDYCDPERLLQERRPATLIVSPGFPLATHWMQDFRRRGGLITSELSLALAHLEQEKIIGVTGSLGKSTVISLLGAGAEAAGESYFLGGNFGVPLADYMSEVKTRHRPRANWLLLELSSFQLENCSGLNCEYSAITYLAPNHLERYSSLEEYYECKWSLISHTRKKIFLNAHSPDLKKFAASRKNQIESVWCSRENSILSQKELTHAQLLGMHNQDNISLAAAIAEACGWNKNYRQGMLCFPGLAHRMQNLGEFRGVRIINDSKATTLESVRTALEGALTKVEQNGKGRVLLLLGGKDKKLPWGDLSDLPTRKNLHVILFGESRALIQKSIGLADTGFPHLKEAVEAASKIAQNDDLLLLSPGGTSYDEFKNFMERGEKFSDYIKEYFS